MKKVRLVFSSRPEAIKDILNLDIRVAVTEQHPEKLDQFLRLFAVESNYNLNILKSLS